jgi:hypothetical protein
MALWQVVLEDLEEWETTLVECEDIKQEDCMSYVADGVFVTCPRLIKDINVLAREKNSEGDWIDL